MAEREFRHKEKPHPESQENTDRRNSRSQEEEGKKISRRKFLGDALAAIGGALVAREMDFKGIPPGGGYVKGRESIFARESLHNFETSYLTGPLEGRRFSSEYSLYTGIEGEAGPEVTVNFYNQLKKMWGRKKEISVGNRVVDQVANEILEEYRNSYVEKMSAKEYVHYIDQVIEPIRESKDFWLEVGKIKNLTNEQLQVVRKVCQDIRGSDLAAYLLTELMPSSNGKINLEVLDFLTSNAGKEYIEYLPALYDDKTSFGPFQFTEYAVYDTPSEKRGASIINQALPKDRRIPGSVSKLRGDDHYKAAYLFAVNNIVNLVVKADRLGKLEVLDKALRSRHLDLVQIVATAHHGPAALLGYHKAEKNDRGESIKIYVPGMAEKWLNDNAHSAFEDYSRGRYTTYAQKTEANLKALREI